MHALQCFYAMAQHTKFLSTEPSTAVCVSLLSIMESTKLGFETAN